MVDATYPTTRAQCPTADLPGSNEYTPEAHVGTEFDNRGDIRGGGDGWTIRPKAPRGTIEGGSPKVPQLR